MNTMSMFCRQNRIALRWLFLVALIQLAAMLPDLCAAEPGPAIVRVEEDWELVVTQPNADDTAPQVTCVVSPYAPNESFYAVFEINHHTLPSFHAGGLQLQVWSYEQAWAVTSASAEGSLEAEGEHVTWTQSVEVADGLVTFTVEGDSPTWGHFGGPDDLSLSESTLLTNLNGYSTAYSLANSSVGFASNRVESLVLKRVRYYSAEGLVSEDDEPHVVFPNE